MKHNINSLATLGRRMVVCLPFLFLSSQVIADQAAEPSASTAPPLTEENINPTASASTALGACPLNSGGPSLLNTKWRLVSIYGNRIPSPMNITVDIGNNQLSGNAGCNNYSTSFRRVGYTGFRVLQTNKTRKACEVIRPAIGAPTVNVGDWEGNYLRTLQRMGSVRQDNNVLRFFNRNGEIGLVWQRDFSS